MPSPVTAPRRRPSPGGAWPGGAPRSAARSALLNTSSSGTRSAPISRQHRRARRRSGRRDRGRWRRRRARGRSASATTSSVLLNASTRPWGSWRTKPTVSVSSTGSPPGSDRRRVVGSSVANRRSSTSTPASVSRLSKRATCRRSCSRRCVTLARPLRPRRLRWSWRVRRRSAQVGLELGDAAHDAAAVDLELGLAAGRSGCRCRRACWARSALGAAAQAGQAVAAAGPARPGPCPRGCGRSGRRCRGSRRCGRWPCGRAASPGCTAGPGVSSLSNTTVSASTARHTSFSSSALPLPMK